MKTKFTKGEWGISYTNEYIYTVKSDGNHIASTMYKDEECLANAKLIAAAPDLLLACYNAYYLINEQIRLNNINFDEQMLDKISKAIEKATI